MALQRTTQIGAWISFTFLFSVNSMAEDSLLKNLNRVNTRTLKAPCATLEELNPEAFFQKYCASKSEVSKMPDYFRKNRDGTLKPEDMVSQELRIWDQYCYDGDDSHTQNYSLKALNFKKHFDSFTGLGGKSVDTTCKYLFWNNGVMKRPHASTLDLISKKSEYIKKMAEKYGVDPVYIACALAGDSMIFGSAGGTNVIEDLGDPKWSGQYYQNGVMDQTWQDVRTRVPSAKDQTPDIGVPDVTQEASEKKLNRFIYQIAVIGKDAKDTYLRGYQGNLLSQDAARLDFKNTDGTPIVTEPEILATLYNLGMKKSDGTLRAPNAALPPSLNYFGLFCLRNRSAFEYHLKGINRSANWK
jgi:hypothetical protein